MSRSFPQSASYPQQDEPPFYPNTHLLKFQTIKSTGFHVTFPQRPTSQLQPECSYYMIGLSQDNVQLFKMAKQSSSLRLDEACTNLAFNMLHYNYGFMC